MMMMIIIIIIFIIIIIIIVIIIITTTITIIKKFSLFSDFYNHAAGFLLVTWGNRKVFYTISIFA